MKHEYGTVTTAIVKQLRKIVGEPNVLVDRERMEGYSHDETSVLSGGADHEAGRHP